MNPHNPDPTPISSVAAEALAKGAVPALTATSKRRVPKTTGADARRHPGPAKTRRLPTNHATE